MVFPPFCGEVVKHCSANRMPTAYIRIPFPGISARDIRFFRATPAFPIVSLTEPFRLVNDKLLGTVNQISGRAIRCYPDTDENRAAFMEFAFSDNPKQLRKIFQTLKKMHRAGIGFVEKALLDAIEKGKGEFDG